MVDLRPRVAPTPAVRFGIDADGPSSRMGMQVQVEQKMIWGWVGVGALGVLGIAALTLANVKR